MEDAQFPPGADDANGARARRSRRRLGDAEAVATTRLDMFGDNSLKEALTGGTPASGDGDAPLEAAEASPADGALPAGSGVDDAQPAVPDLPWPDTPPPPSSDLQRLDPAVGAGDGPSSASDLDHSDPDAAPLPQAGSPDPHQSSEPEPDPTAAATPAHMPVSAIFSALDAAERQAGAQRNDEAPALSDMPDPTPPDAPQRNGWASVSAELISRARQEGDAVAEDAAGSIAATADELGAATAFPAVQDSEVPSFPGPGEALPYPPPSSEFPDLSEGPPFPDGSAITPSADLSQPPPFRSELEPPPAPPMLDAAAQIAAEADATAEALDNLTRMLENKLPDFERAEPAGHGPHHTGEGAISSPPLVGGLRMSWQPEPPPFAGRTAAPLLPLHVPPEPRSGKRIYLLGFLTGLGLSLMAGAVLYFFINMG